MNVIYEIAKEFDNLRNAKEDLRVALINKGVTMTDIEYVRYLRQTAIALKFSFPPNFKKYNSQRLVKRYNGIGAA